MLASQWTEGGVTGPHGQTVALHAVDNANDTDCATTLSPSTAVPAAAAETRRRRRAVVPDAQVTEAE